MHLHVLRLHPMHATRLMYACVNGCQLWRFHRGFPRQLQKVLQGCAGQTMMHPKLFVLWEFSLCSCVNGCDFFRIGRYSLDDIISTGRTDQLLLLQLRESAAEMGSSLAIWLSPWLVISGTHAPTHSHTDQTDRSFCPYHAQFTRFVQVAITQLLKCDLIPHTHPRGGYHGPQRRRLVAAAKEGLDVKLMPAPLPPQANMKPRQMSTR